MSLGRSPSKLSVLPLVATLFFVVSGGPNGLEDIVRQSGPGACLLLLVVTPLIWALPCALMSAELTSAIPEEGGYYVWVTRALGPFWGFTCALWSWIYGWFDLAVYPALVIGLLREAGMVNWAGHGLLSDFLLNLGIVLPFVVLNVFGIRPAGRGSLVLGALVVAPYLGMVLLGRVTSQAPIHQPFFNPEHGLWGSLGLGLAVCMWNYQGWDNLSTVASEVEDPQRAYPKAIAWTLPLIVCCYVAVVAAALTIFPNWRGYESGIWVQIARIAGGTPLFVAVFVAGVASSLGQFNGMLLSVSRLPFVLARDGYLPKPLAWQHPKWQTPVVAIGVVFLVDLVLSMKSFSDLIELDVLFYSAGVVLEFVALAVLRRKEPDLVRPYRIPWGWAGIALASVPPLLLIAVTSGITLSHLEPFKLTFFGVAIVAPILFYFLRSRRLKG